MVPRIGEHTSEVYSSKQEVFFSLAKCLRGLSLRKGEFVQNRESYYPLACTNAFSRIRPSRLSTERGVKADGHAAAVLEAVGALS